MYLLEPCIGKEETQILATHKSDTQPGTSAFSPSQECPGPILGLDSSTPSIPCSSWAHRLFSLREGPGLRFTYMATSGLLLPLLKPKLPTIGPLSPSSQTLAARISSSLYFASSSRGRNTTNKYLSKVSCQGHVHGPFLPPSVPLKNHGQQY